MFFSHVSYISTPTNNWEKKVFINTKHGQQNKKEQREPQPNTIEMYKCYIDIRSPMTSNFNKL